MSAFLLGLRAFGKSLFSPFGAAVMGLLLILAVAFSIGQNMEIRTLEKMVNDLRDDVASLTERLTSEREGRQSDRLLLIEANSKEVETARTREAELNKTIKVNSDDYAEKLRLRAVQAQADAATVAALRSERKRLLDRIAAFSAPSVACAARSAGSAPTSAECIADARASRLGELLGEGTTLHYEGGELRAEARQLIKALTDQVMALQKHIRDTAN